MLLLEIQNKIQNAQHLDFGQIFNESIELFKKVWINGFVTLLLTFTVIVLSMFIVAMPLSFFGVLADANPHMLNEIGPLMLLLAVLFYFILIFMFVVVTLGFKAAFFRILFQHDMNLPLKDDYFYFFKRPYLGKTITISFAYVGINVLAILLCYLPIFYVLVPMNLLIVIYAFNPDLSVSNLVKLSFELGNKKWFITFGLTLVAGMLAQVVGVLMCFIGIVFTASFVSMPLYFIYKRVIGFEHSEILKIEY